MTQLFINIVGHNSSGKTTLAKRLATDLSLNRVSGDDFRNFVHQNITYFRDTDISYPNSRYAELNPLVIEYRFELSWILLRAGQNVLFDGSGGTKAYRAKYLDEVRQHFPNVKTVLIFADLPEAELLNRLTQRGAAWAAQYHDIKKRSFQEPTPDEADYIFRYDQNNYAEIKQNLQGLLT